MNILEKIEDIRRQPEHIRLRFVWGAVAISMFVIFGIWIFSLGSLFHGDSNSIKQSSADIKAGIQDIQQQAPSIKDFTDLQSAPKKAVVIDDSTAPQTSAYSDLVEQQTNQQQ